MGALMGLWIKSEAPTANPVSSYSSSFLEVMKMTGMSTSFGLAFRRRQASKPSISGIMTSSKIRSGGLANASSSAAFALLNNSRHEQTKMQCHCQQYRSNLTNGKAENDKW